MKQIIPIYFKKTNTNNDPSLWLLKSEWIWLVHRSERGKQIQIIQILWILRISQYIEVKSEKILKIYGFHRYILKYPQNKMNTIHSTNWLLKYRNDKLTSNANNINNMNEPNKLDHRCPLKWGNTRSNYLVHNIQIYWQTLDKCTNFKDLIEIHRFHNIWSEIQTNIERNPQNCKDFRTNIAKNTVI